MKKYFFAFLCLFQIFVFQSYGSDEIRENQIQKDEGILELKFFEGETFQKRFGMDIVKSFENRPQRMNVKTNVFFKVTGVDEQGNYLIAARPSSIELEVKQTDGSIKKMSARINVSDVKGESFTLVISPKGQLHNTQKIEGLKFDLTELKNSNSKNGDVDESFLSDTLLPMMQGLITTTLFNYPDFSIADGQTWESNAMVSPPWKFILGNDKMLVKNIETPKQIDKTKFTIASNQVYVSPQDYSKIYLSLGKSKVQIDPKTNWIQSAHGEWWISAHAPDEKGQKKALPKNEFSIRAKISIE